MNTTQIFAVKSQRFDDTWIYHARLIGDKHLAVRLLWQQHQSAHDLPPLDEHAYPYRSGGYFISFSHSMDACAMIVSATPCAVDIEKRPISQKVAQRFFGDDAPRADNAMMRARLWRFKECWIKLHHGKLVSGLAHPAPSLPHLPMDCPMQIDDYHLFEHECITAIWQAQ